jgi:hypothetical protein
VLDYAGALGLDEANTTRFAPAFLQAIKNRDIAVSNAAA